MRAVLAAAIGGVVLAASDVWAHPGHASLPDPVDGHTHALIGAHDMVAIAAVFSAALMVLIAAIRARATRRR